MFNGKLYQAFEKKYKGEVNKPLLIEENPQNAVPNREFYSSKRQKNAVMGDLSLAKQQRDRSYNLYGNKTRSKTLMDKTVNFNQ